MYVSWGLSHPRSTWKLYGLIIISRKSHDHSNKSDHFLTFSSVYPIKSNTCALLHSAYQVVWKCPGLWLTRYPEINFHRPASHRLYNIRVWLPNWRQLYKFDPSSVCHVLDLVLFFIYTGLYESFTHMELLTHTSSTYLCFLFSWSLDQHLSDPENIYTGQGIYIGLAIFSVQNIHFFWEIKY